jgi:hypothetical protein
VRYNDKSSKVMTVQRVLLDRGYKLPQFGADGHLGEETWDALQQYAADRGLKWEPKVPQEVVSSLISPYVPTTMPAPPGRPTMDVSNIRLIDLRDEQPDPPPPVRGKMKLKKGRDGKIIKRAPEAIDTIVIHQTATPFSATKQAKKEWPDDPQRALAERAKGVACHVMAFKEGFLAWPNPLDWYVYHGNGFNKNSLGIEIEGRYPGLMDDPSTTVREDWETTWGGKPDEVTDECVLAARAGVRLLVEEGRKMGMPIQFVVAHRQSSANRRSDPGEELWRRVVLEYAVPVLNLETMPALVLGSGRPVPKEWDLEGTGKY